MIGKKVWATGDGFMNKTSNGGFDTHEALCVLNAGKKDANTKITIFFEDREPLEGFNIVCKARRSTHIRLDWIENDKGEKVPYGVPYSMLLESDQPVVVQHSRMDVTQPEMTLMTTIAFS